MFLISIALRWAIVQLAGHRILAPIIKVRVLVAQPIRPYRLVGPGQRPFTPSTGVRIPLGTPNEVKGLHENATLFLFVCGANLPALRLHGVFYFVFFLGGAVTRLPPIESLCSFRPVQGRERDSALNGLRVVPESP